MTSYPAPDFDGVTIGLDRIPGEAELFPDDDTIWLGAYAAEIVLVGTRRKFKVELMFKEVQADPGDPVDLSIWAATGLARKAITTHVNAGGRFRIRVGTLSFDARLCCLGLRPA